MRSEERTEDVVEGSRSPSPPRRTGSASSVLSIVEHGGLPISAGIRCNCIAFSRGCSRSSMSGIVLTRYQRSLATFTNSCLTTRYVLESLGK